MWQIDGRYLLVDTGPDLRQQLLRLAASDALPADCSPRPRVDAVLYTHAHADHVHGLDDLRSLNFLQRSSIRTYGSRQTLDEIRLRFDYAFGGPSVAGGGKPSLEPHVVEPGQPVIIAGVEVIPVRLDHVAIPCLGYRIGRAAWCTDVRFIPPESVPLLTGLDLLVLGALRPTPHPTHMTIAQALRAIEMLAPERALFVHMTHDVDHATIEASLPDHVRLAIDGMVIDLG